MTQTRFVGPLLLLQLRHSRRVRRHVDGAARVRPEAGLRRSGVGLRYRPMVDLVLARVVGEGASRHRMVRGPLGLLGPRGGRWGSATTSSAWKSE